MTQENRHVELYADKKTGLVYEAQLADSSALVRPASPALYSFIERISLDEFYDRFEEFSGDRDAVKAFAAIGKPAPFTVETRH